MKNMLLFPLARIIIEVQCKHGENEDMHADIEGKPNFN